MDNIRTEAIGLAKKSMQVIGSHTVIAQFFDSYGSTKGKYIQDKMLAAL